MEKWGDHRRKKFFIHNSVEALIPFKVENQGLLKLHVPVGGGWGVEHGGKNEGSPKEGIFFETEKMETVFTKRWVPLER